MRRRGPAAALMLAAALAAALPPPAAAAGERVVHDLQIELDPASHHLQVTDRLTLPPRLAVAGSELLLNAALAIESSEPPLERLPLGEVPPFASGNAGEEAAAGVELARYRLASAPPDGVLTLTYGGRFDFGLSAQEEEYTRGFRETAGIVGEQGVYLAGGGFWYPSFDGELVEFRLAARVPDGWRLISQGDGSSRDDSGWARWDSAGPTDEIYLVGGPLRLYHEAGAVAEAEVYLHEADDALAQRYLTATAQYLEMYRQLIGPYPYRKFALVENFWETGFGMPSFTLLGPTVLRFPFIITSSYPHEILHNWWGNSVFVDYQTGNWSEGLTAYLADHLIQEQRGKGDEYRRATLQKYRDYVQQGPGRDFPLTGFRSRASAATEAVGYGKTLMVFHMLRRHLGDDAFRTALARFYRDERGRRASFADLERTFSAVAGEDLGWFFRQWVERTGAPVLRLVGALPVTASAGRQALRITLEQTQPGEPYVLEVPVAVRTTAGVTETTVQLGERGQEVDIPLPALPLAVDVDPAFDIFRVLDPRETAPSIGQLFGEPKILALLPAAAGEAEREAYRALLEGWVSDSLAIDVELDSAVAALPADRSVWILGRDNRFLPALSAALPAGGLDLTGEKVRLGGEEVAAAGHSLVVIARHPADPERALGWLVVDPAAAFPGMGRKLPHYGKYSYLAFAGDEPTNVVKGQWATSDSPLSLDLRLTTERATPLPPVALAPRPALAELPPVFSEAALAAHVAYLAAPEREGRGVGTAGLAAARGYVVERLREAGLKPGGEGGGYLQPFTLPEGPAGHPEELANVVAVLPGSRADFAGQAVVVGAHYDHLGRGWPDVHQGDEGRIHPGADDNASGVAVLLELAKSFAAGEPPPRTLVFVAFSGEEAGRAGSRYYVDHPLPVPLAGIRAMVNLDTVGRLGAAPISVLGTGTAEEWQHIFRGVGFVTGIESRDVPEAAGGSDQMSFIERGVPAVQIFATAHGDYHRSTDTADKVDAAGLVEVATFVKEAVSYLVERPEPLTVTIAGTAAPAGTPTPVPGGRRVRLGTVPDFAFAGPGVRIDSVVPDSPAERAGVAPGDVLLSIDGHEIADLKAYSELLKTLSVDQTVTVVVRRGEETVELSATLEAR